MTWSVKFQITDGQVDVDTLAVVGRPPDGPATLTGYESSQGIGLGVSMRDMSVSTFAPASPSAPIPGRSVDADELAHAAYRAYGARADGKNHRGEPMPKWSELDDDLRSAWTGAATEVMRRTITGE